ncbi:MAG: hypothetical protein EOO43_14150 [Flavobacterium sp.]|nr:MAG: hypothetical protein EOO43_14150 [Flavobacterium sp.]
MIEKALGIKPGNWQFTADGKPNTLTMITIKNPKALNIRMSSGNELSANPYWIPGGLTSGGKSEALVDLIPRGSYIEELVSSQ